MRLQVLVTDQRGLNIPSLIRAIEDDYVTPDGNWVRVEIGQGEFVDGLPVGALRLVDRRPS